jgi:hypothetical protein
VAKESQLNRAEQSLSQLKAIMMTFDYSTSAELFILKGKRAACQGRRRFATAQWQFASPGSPRSARSAHGCGWEISASTAMTFRAYTRALVVRSAVAGGN